MTDYENNIQTEINLIFLEETSGIGKMLRGFVRISIRGLRILFGLLLFGFSIWAGITSWDVLSIPFSRQSVIGIIKGLALGAICIWLLQTSFSCAFGPGPDKEDEYQRRRRLALYRLGDRVHLTNAHGYLDHPVSQSGKAYAAGKWIGRLFSRARNR